MNFKYIVLDRLPALSWLADVDYKKDVVTVYCGRQVETRDRYFVSGVWDDSFDAPTFDTSNVFFGTGAKLDGEAVSFVTPSHGLERLVVHESTDHVEVSNSLSFLMAYSKLELDLSVNQYEAILCSILDGYDKMDYSVPMDGGESIRQYIVSVVSVQRDGQVLSSRRRRMRPFKSFDDYYTSLVSSMQRVRENSISESRKKKYSLVTTISRGYDSAACSRIARVIGCERAVTITGGRYDLDDGSVIARELGYTDIVKRDRLSYKSNPNMVDAEIVSSGEIGSGIQLCVFEDVFSGNLVFVGSRGTYWDKSCKLAEDLEMIGYFNFETNTGTTENALRNGYIIIPLPAYGATVCNSIKAISNSEEMKPWSIGGKYDKPIPRRILETAGVNRNDFGQVKRGGGFSLNHDTMKSLSVKMSDLSYEDFLIFRKTRPLPKKNVDWIRNFFKYNKENFPIIVNYAAGKAGLKIRLKIKATRTANPCAPAELFFWATDVMKKRYAAAINTRDSV